MPSVSVQSASGDGTFSLTSVGAYADDVWTDELLLLSAKNRFTSYTGLRFSLLSGDTYDAGDLILGAGANTTLSIQPDTVLDFSDAASILFPEDTSSFLGDVNFYVSEDNSVAAATSHDLRMKGDSGQTSALATQLFQMDGTRDSGGNDYTQNIVMKTEDDYYRFRREASGDFELRREWASGGDATFDASDTVFFIPQYQTLPVTGEEASKYRCVGMFNNDPVASFASIEGDSSGTMGGLVIGNQDGFSELNSGWGAARVGLLFQNRGDGWGGFWLDETGNMRHHTPGDFQSNASSFVLNTNGTDRFSIDDAGEFLMPGITGIGIGQASPGTFLHIGDNATAGLRDLRLENDSGIAEFRVAADGSVEIGSGGNTNLVLLRNDAAVLVLQSDSIIQLVPGLVYLRGTAVGVDANASEVLTVTITLAGIVTAASNILARISATQQSAAAVATGGHAQRTIAYGKDDAPGEDITSTAATDSAVGEDPTIASAAGGASTIIFTVTPSGSATDVEVNYVVELSFNPAVISVVSQAGVVA